MTRPTREHGTAPIVDVCDVCEGTEVQHGSDGYDYDCATCEGTGHVCTHCRVWPCECRERAEDYAADIASEES